MRAVSFGLWGDNPKYCEGAVANAWLMPRIYPGWQMHLWLDKATVPASVAARLRPLGVFLHDPDPRIARIFSRFLIHDEPGVERYIIRDCDSRISMRERRCVDQWIEAGTLLHTIHDHPYHMQAPPIMGGLWGFWRERDASLNMRSLLLRSHLVHNNNWGSDQFFLTENIWPRYRHSVTQHGKVLPITPDPEDPDAFCGEIVGADGVPNAQHREMKRRGYV